MSVILGEDFAIIMSVIIMVHGRRGPTARVLAINATSVVLHIGSTFWLAVIAMSLLARTVEDIESNRVFSVAVVREMYLSYKLRQDACMIVGNMGCRIFRESIGWFVGRLISNGQ